MYTHRRTSNRYNNTVYIHVYRWNNSTGIRGEKCILRADVGESMRNEEECAAFEIKKFPILPIFARKSFNRVSEYLIIMER